MMDTGAHRIEIGGRIVDNFKILKLDPGRRGKPIGEFEFFVDTAKSKVFPTLDLKDEVYVLKRDTRVFGGFIDEMFYSDEKAVFVCKGGNSDWDYLRSSFNFLNTNPIKIMYFVARMGYKKDKINFHGQLLKELDLTEREYVVMVPVKNLVLENEVRVGDVIFENASDSVEEQLIRKSTAASLDSDWSNTLPRAQVTIRSTNFYDAIDKAYAKISRAIDLIAFRTDITFPTYEQNTQRLEFSNVRYYSRVTLTNKVFCKEKESDSACLFDRSVVATTTLRLDQEAQEYLTPVAQFKELLLKSEEDLSDEERLAAHSLHWLRNALYTLDPIGKLINLSLALEFAASGIGAEKLFTKNELSEIKNQIANIKVDGKSLSQRQLKAIQTRVEDLNDAPLLARIRKFVDDHHIPFSESEFKIIQNIRRKRNDIQHGRKNVQVERQELDKLQSLIERIIIERKSNSN